MIGTRLGIWRIDKELGQGGMGSVWRARAEHDPGSLPSVVALKILAPELAREEGLRQRFRREIDILSKLEHPNIVRFLGSGEENGVDYYTMEMVDGPSYQTIIEERRKLPWQEVLDLAEQMAKALKHAHDRGVVHRDLKPSNLLRAKPATPETPALVKLSDFGIASLFASRHLTVPGGVLGTADYMSPEQAAGKPVTRRSDLYSLGVVLYTLVTGRTPFDGDMIELMHKHRYGQFDKPGRIVQDLPHDFDAIICQLLEKDPAKRPADGTILGRQLARVRTKGEAKTKVDLERLVNRDPGPGEGPATFASQMVRAELEEIKRGGRLRQLFNNVWVVLPLFLLATGLLVWLVWPLSNETRFQRGAALMASSEPKDWERGWTEYLQPLKQADPTFKPQEMSAFEQKYQTYDESQRAEGEGQWFYRLGLRKLHQGDRLGARRTFDSLVTVFKGIPSETAWVYLARIQLDELGAGREEEKGVRKVPDVLGKVIEKAKKLREDGSAKEADALLQGLRELYKNDLDLKKLLEP